jgi:hypothetical protein
MQADALSDADSMHWRLFGSRGRPKSPCVKPAPFQMQIQCTRDHHRGCGRRRPLGPASGQHRQCITQNNPARPSAPTRHTRQRIKPSMCRLGIQSEQTSETTISSPRLRPAFGADPVARPAASAAGELRKKENPARRSAPTQPRRVLCNTSQRNNGEHR